MVIPYNQPSLIEFSFLHSTIFPAPACGSGMVQGTGDTATSRAALPPALAELVENQLEWSSRSPQTVSHKKIKHTCPPWCPRCL